MSLDYIWEGINAKPTVPYSPATGLDNANNFFYVSSRATKTKPGVWVPVGGQSFQTNSVPNAIQSIENLIAGSNVVLTPDEMGGTTISSLGGAASFEGVVIIDGRHQCPTPGWRHSIRSKHSDQCCTMDTQLCIDD